MTQDEQDLMVALLLMLIFMAIAGAMHAGWLPWPFRGVLP